MLIETGLRGGDACNLVFSSVFQDSTGWPCLRFEATKVRTEQLVPLSAKAAAAIADQQAYVREHWPGGSPWLFPGLADNDDGSKPYSHSHFTRQLVAWQKAIDLHDQAGRAGAGDRPPVPPHPRDPAHQSRRPPARRAEAPRPRQRRT